MIPFCLNVLFYTNNSDLEWECINLINIMLKNGNQYA
jgi:hypothetical protein